MFNSLFDFCVSFVLALSAVGGTQGAAGVTFEHTGNGPFFTLPLQIGDPQTKVTVGVESYYAASAVYGVGAKCDGSDAYCVPHETYDKKNSKTYKEIVASRSFDFSLGTVTGSVGMDRFSLGSLQLDQRPMAVAESVPRNLNRYASTSGFLSMTAPRMSDADKSSLQLFAEGADKPTVTLFAPLNTNDKHTITIGKEDTTNCAADWISLPNVAAVDPNNQPWTVQLESYSWDTSKEMGTINVALSTAADYFVAPKRHANFLWTELNAYYSSNYGGGIVDCALQMSAPDFVFSTADKQEIRVPATQFIKKYSDGVCLLNVYPDELNQWTLPYMFHQLFCVRYDYGAKTVGFAKKLRA